MTSDKDEYVTISEACARLGIERAQLKRLLRKFGFAHLLQSVPEQNVTMRWSDLEGFAGAAKPGAKKTA